jgi:hypothetical protein
MGDDEYQERVRQIFARWDPAARRPPLRVLPGGAANETPAASAGSEGGGGLSGAPTASHDRRALVFASRSALEASYRLMPDRCLEKVVAASIERGDVSHDPRAPGSTAAVRLPDGLVAVVRRERRPTGRRSWLVVSLRPDPGCRASAGRARRPHTESALATARKETRVRVGSADGGCAEAELCNAADTTAAPLPKAAR